MDMSAKVILHCDSDDCSTVLLRPCKIFDLQNQNYTKQVFHRPRQANPSGYSIGEENSYIAGTLAPMVTMNNARLEILHPIMLSHLHK